MRCQPFLLFCLIHHGIFCIKVENDDNIPMVVESGTSAILDCNFEVTGEAEISQLEIKWYFNDEPIPFYMWVPSAGRGPQIVSPEFLDSIDLNFETSEVHFTAYSSLRLIETKSSMTGNYLCKISTFEDEQFIERNLLIYTPPRRVVLLYSEEDGFNHLVRTINLTCNVENVYPEPQVKLLWTTMSSDDTEIGSGITGEAKSEIIDDVGSGVTGDAGSGVASDVESGDTLAGLESKQYFDDAKYETIFHEDSNTYSVTVRHSFNEDQLFGDGQISVSLGCEVLLSEVEYLQTKYVSFTTVPLPSEESSGSGETYDGSGSGSGFSGSGLSGDDLDYELVDGDQTIEVESDLQGTPETSSGKSSFKFSGDRIVFFIFLHLGMSFMSLTILY